MIDDTIDISDPMLPRPYRARKAKRETIDTVTVEFVPEDGGEVPVFKTGQFNMLYLFGVGEIPISISGDPTKRRSLIHTTRDVGPVSKAFCMLKPGDVIGVRGPFGSHWPVEQADGKDLVVVAGGLGLAPLRSVVYQAIAQREKFARVFLLYSAHMPENLLYRRELEQWRARFDLEVDIVVGHADRTWRGDVGYVTKFIPRAHFDPANTVAMICGPEILMRFSAVELQGRGVSTDTIYITMERNMKCGIGLCGHCQFSPHFVCKDGPVFQYSQVQDLLVKAEV